MLTGYWNWSFVLPTRTDGDCHFREEKKKRGNETSLGKKLRKKNSKLDSEESPQSIYHAIFELAKQKQGHLSIIPNTLPQPVLWRVPAPHLTTIRWSGLTGHHVVSGKPAYLCLIWIMFAQVYRAQEEGSVDGQIVRPWASWCRWPANCIITGFVEIKLQRQEESHDSWAGEIFSFQ